MKLLSLFLFLILITNSFAAFTSIHTADFDIPNGNVTSTSYALFHEEEFNLTHNMEFILSSSLYAVRIIGAGDTELYMKMTMDGDTILDKKLRTFTTNNRYGVIAIPEIALNGTIGNHTGQAYFRVSNAATVEINDLDIIMVSNHTTANQYVNYSLIDSNYILNTTVGFEQSFNYSYNVANAKNLFMQTSPSIYSAATKPTGTFYFENINTLAITPQWKRKISDTGTTGSMRGLGIFNNTGLGINNFTIRSSTDEDDTHINGTIWIHELADAGSNTINSNSSSNPYNNTNPLTLTTDYQLSTELNLTVQNGTGIYLSYQASIFQTTGNTRDVTFLINVSNNSFSEETIRTLFTTDRLGNVPITDMIDGTLQIGETYLIQVYVKSSGIGSQLLDDSLAVFETYKLNTSTQQFISTDVSYCSNPPGPCTFYSGDTVNTTISYIFNNPLNLANNSSCLGTYVNSTFNGTDWNDETITAFNFTQNYLRNVYSLVFPEDGLYTITCEGCIGITCNSDTTTYTMAGVNRDKEEDVKGEIINVTLILITVLIMFLIIKREPYDANHKETRED